MFNLKVKDGRVASPLTTLHGYSDGVAGIIDHLVTSPCSFIASRDGHDLRDGEVQIVAKDVQK